MDSGYTVEYPTDGILLPVVIEEYANAGGSVHAPAMIPISNI